VCFTGDSFARVKDLVRVRVSDSAEQPWVGQRSLLALWFSRIKSFRNSGEIGFQHFETAALELFERLLSPHEARVKRDASSRPR